jgi:hypothetical protein
MDNVIWANTVGMNEEQHRNHIQEINTGLVAPVQLPTTNRINELLKGQECVKNAEARLSDLLEEGKKIVTQRDNWKQELTLTHQRLTEIGGRTPECCHGDLEEKVSDLERQLGTRAPEPADLAGDLEAAQAQLGIMRQLANEYREQVTRLSRLTEGRTGSEGHQKEREEIGNEIAHFPGENQKELWGWKVQLALTMARNPRTFKTENEKLGYAVG